MHRPHARTCPRPAAALAAAAALFCLLLAGLPGTAADRVHAAQADLERVIIELAGAPALAPADAGAAGHRPAAVSARRETVREQHAAVLAGARRAGIGVRESRAFTLLINAVAAEVPAAEVDRLRHLEGVVAVHPDRSFTASLDVSVPLVDAPAVWEQTDGEGRPVTGAGRTVAIVDTGVDYTHPALGGGFGPGHKVVGGYDYANDDADPMDDHSHGTHVAGIVAGKGEITGVAPDATLTAYKVLDAAGRGQESAIIAALEDAADPANPHRADVINLSLGAPDGGGTGPLDTAADRAAAAGVVVVAAAGNSGPGHHTISTPASAERVLAVGASISGVRAPSLQSVHPEEHPLPSNRLSYSANPPDQPLEAELVDVGHGLPDDFVGLDVEGKAVIAAVPPESGSGVARLAEERGAVAALFYTPVGTPVHPGFDAAGARPGGTPQGHDFRTGAGPGAADFDGRFERIVAVSLDASAYGLIERLRHGGDGTVTVRIDGTDITDEIAEFSSRGPSAGYALKPEIAAPGVLIDSSVPAALLPGDRYRFSGTSMAAPHVAGAAALLRQLRPEWSEAEVRGALVGSARRVDRWGPLAQGAGRLDLARAAATTVVASPPALSLGVADHTRDRLEASATVTLTNRSDAPAEVSFEHRSHGGDVTLRVRPDRVTLAAGGRAEVTVDVAAERSGTDADVTGWLEAEVAGEEAALRVPYALAERHLTVHVPDPAYGTAEALVHSPAPLAGPPALTVTAPSGETTAIDVRPDGERWWRADVPIGDPGVYRLEAIATTTDRAGGATIGAQRPFEVLAAHERLRGASAWQPVGPDADGGALATAGPRGLVVGTEKPAELFVTADRGRTWRQHADLPVTAAQSGHVAVDPGDPARIYYAVNGGAFDGTYRGKILASADAGHTWTTLPFPDIAIASLDIDATGHVLLANTADALWVSRDRGATWEQLAAPWPPYALTDTALIGPDLYLATRRGLWVVRGISSATSSPELVWEPSKQEVTAVAGDERWLFAATIGDDGQSDPRSPGRWFGEVYGSDDGGATWRPLVETDNALAHGLGLVGTDLFVQAHGQLLVGSSYGSDFQRWDEPAFGGLTQGFTAWASPGRAAKGRAGGSGEVLLGQMASGVWASGDGQDWRRLGVPGVTVHDLAVLPGTGGSETLLAGTAQGVYRTTAPTGAVTPDVRDWGRSGAEGMYSIDVTHVAFAPDDPSVLYRAMKTLWAFYIARSDDGGATWVDQHLETEFPLDLLVHPADPERVYVSFWNLAASGLLVSDDGGASWGVHYHPEHYLAIAGDPRDPNRLWLGNERGLYRSDDGGTTAELVREGHVTAIEIDPHTPDRIVVGGEELAVSDDGGTTFHAGERADVPILVSAVVTSPADPHMLFAGSQTFYRDGLPYRGRGVLASRDGGRTWTSLSDGLQNRSVTSLAPTGDGRYLYAGTSAGVHRLRTP